MEADRVMRYKYKELDLYYKDPYGEMVPIAEAYDAEVEEALKQIFKKKRMRYFITFTEALDMQDDLPGSAHKLIRFFCRYMTYGNKLTGYGIRDIQAATSMNNNFITDKIRVLCEYDILRFTVKKGRRTYMLNPVYFYKGTMKKLFACIREFEAMPKRDGELKEVFESKDTIF